MKSISKRLESRLLTKTAKNLDAILSRHGEDLSDGMKSVGSGISNAASNAKNSIVKAKDNAARDLDLYLRDVAIMKSVGKTMLWKSIKDSKTLPWLGVGSIGLGAGFGANKIIEKQSKKKNESHPQAEASVPHLTPIKQSDGVPFFSQSNEPKYI